MEHRNNSLMGEVFASHYTPGIHHAAWSPVDWWYPASSAGQTIEYTITSLITSAEPDYVGLKKATVVVRGGPGSLVGSTVDVYDHSGCIFDELSMAGYTGWAHWSQYRTLDGSKACEVLTPFHWAAINRCCDANSGTYRSC